MVSLYDPQFFHSSILVWFAEKHGTCSCPIIQDEYSYFSTALGLYFKNNMTEVLNNAGILATNGEKYPLGDVVATIKRAFGASPLLVCKHGSLQELRLCFYKDFKVRMLLQGLLIAAKWRSQAFDALTVA
ncbi:hypothetical protein GW17_00055151 [Ensete ventricosum]|nr:hypothetical protein GW17_00055151 [Ensete ventricosum]